MLKMKSKITANASHMYKLFSKRMKMFQKKLNSCKEDYILIIVIV